MSKKMMKRSLALGALMAFVITGSAMAADYAPEDVKIPKGNNVGVIFNETITGYDNVTLTNSLGNGLGTGTNVVNATTKVTINALIGINGYGNNTVSAPTIEINATDDGIFVPHEGNAKVNVNGFNSLTINATEGHAVINNGLATNENSLVIKGNVGSTITLNGNAGRPTIAAKTDSANTSISAGTITVNGNSDNKYKGVIYAANGSNLSVVADNIIVNNDGSNADNAVVRIEASNNSEDGTKVVLGGNAITINANGARGVNVRNGTGVDVGGNGSVELGDANTKTININDASYGILVQYNGTSAAVKVQSGELNIVNDAGNGVAG
ncbi:MAG: hypothetical protein IKT51_05600, partial [Phascolarctobacterium sp.]|nr:hypothetical protein [Phascolarctobacterium sp.]